MTQDDSDLSTLLTKRARTPRRASFAVEDVRVAILAGGRGTRLAPYTSVLPKPLMPVGERAILEIVLDQLSEAGFRSVTLCVGYLSHLIRAVLDDGRDYGVTIEYVHETNPVGTAGPLRLIDGIADTFVAMNGDVLTTLDYRELVAAHKRSGSLLTIATRVRKVTLDYGVLELGGRNAQVRRVTGFKEKPEVSMPMSMGVYVLEPRALDFIPAGEYFDFPDLVQALLEAEEPVGSYGYDGYWLDIGRHEDYEEANRSWNGSRALFTRA